MKTNIFFTIFSLLITCIHWCSAQQTELNGVVAIFNSEFETGNRQYVVNAIIEEDNQKSQRALSASDGTFKLPIIGIKPLEPVYFSVIKDGFEVVNTDALEAVAGQNDPVRIYMSANGALAENRMRYYKINREKAEAALNQKLAELEEKIKKAKGNENKVKALQAEYQTLIANFQQLDAISKALAEQYTKVNLDDESETYRKAYRYYIQGDLDLALQTFEYAKLPEKVDEILKAIKRNTALKSEYQQRLTTLKNEKRQTMEALRFKAGLHQTQYDFEKAENCFNLLMKLDSMDIANLNPYFDLLLTQNRGKMAIRIGKRCLSLVKNESDRANILIQLGVACLTNFEKEESSFYLDSAYALARKLEKINPKKDGSKLFAALLFSGLNASTLNQSESAIKLINEAIKLIENINDKNEYDLELIFAKIQLAAIHNLNEKYQESQELLFNIIKQLEELVSEEKINPFFQLLTTNLILTNYNNLKDYENAKIYLSKGENILNQFRKTNPRFFDLLEMDFLDQKTTILQETGLRDSAATIIQQRINNIKQIKVYNPEQAQKIYEISLYDKGLNFYYSQKFDSSIQVLNSAIIDLKKQPKYDKNELANRYYSLANSYLGKFDAYEATLNYSESVNLYESLIKEHLAYSQENYAFSLKNLAYIYKNTYQFEKASYYFIQAKQQYNKMLLTPLQEVFLGETNLWLAEVRFFQKQTSELEELFKEALIHFQHAADKNEKSAISYLGYTWLTKANYYQATNLFKEEEYARKESIKFYLKADSLNPGTFTSYLAVGHYQWAISLRSLGDTATMNLNFKKSKNYFEQISDSLLGINAIWKAMLYGDMGHYFGQQNNWDESEKNYWQSAQIYSNLISKKKLPNHVNFYASYSGLTFLAGKYYETKNYLKLQNLSENLLQLFETLKTINDTLKTCYIYELGRTTYSLLFAQKFEQTEQRARQALALDPKQIWIKTNLAHALLFQNRYEEAYELYNELKSLPIQQGFSYSNECLKDLRLLEEYGITHKNIEKIRAFLLK